jgi:hypothetical protein
MKQERCEQRVTAAAAVPGVCARNTTRGTLLRARAALSERKAQTKKHNNTRSLFKKPSCATPTKRASRPTTGA